MRDLVHDGVRSSFPRFTIEIQVPLLTTQRHRPVRYTPVLCKSWYTRRWKRHSALSTPRRPARARVPNIQTFPALPEPADSRKHTASQHQGAGHAHVLSGTGSSRLLVSTLPCRYHRERIGAEISQHTGYVLVQSRNHDYGRVRGLCPGNPDRENNREFLRVDGCVDAGATRSCHRI